MYRQPDEHISTRRTTLRDEGRLAFRCKKECLANRFEHPTPVCKETPLAIAQVVALLDAARLESVARGTTVPSGIRVQNENDLTSGADPLF